MRTPQPTSPLESLARRLTRGEAVVAGVLSGTSADGIDVALVRFAPARSGELGAPTPLAFATRPFAASLAARVREVLDGGAPTLGQLAGLDRDLGQAFGRAARELARATGVELDLVASHGQTVWHHDGTSATGPATLQLGDGCACAEAAGCTVASDFRRRDIAAGGEGAPLSALADDVVFASAPRPLHVLNLGGLANLTCLADGEPTVAFDTGPAGSLLDGLARRFLGAPFDEGGATAASGAVRRDWLAAWLEHPYFAFAPPKSTGRDTFGEAWIERLLAAAGDAPDAAELLATATELVARTVAEARERFAPHPHAPLVVAGGGVHNRALLAGLEAHTGAEVLRSDEVGVDPDAREALVFAVLGARLVLGLPSPARGIPSPTGAASGRPLGKLSLSAG